MSNKGTVNVDIRALSLFGAVTPQVHQNGRAYLVSQLTLANIFKIKKKIKEQYEEATSSILFTRNVASQSIFKFYPNE